MDIISMLPPEWQAFAIVAMEIIVTVAAAVALLKPLLVKYIGEPTSNDPGWKRAIFTAIKVLDYVALNSATVTTRRKLADTKQTLNAISSIPPRTSGDSQ
jgi:hypothetical protein